MRAHRKTHENELNMECEICGEVLNRYIRYRRHMNNVHGVEKAFVCKQCPEGPDRPRYSSQSGLNQHIERDHLGVKNHQCPHCPKKFWCKGVLEKHQRVHDGKKPYQCPHCGQRFTQRQSQRDHIRVVHLKEKRFECSFCGKRFATKTAQQSHEVSQHNNSALARFQCKVCLKWFYEANHYHRHVENRHRPKDPKKEMVKRGECYWPGCGKVYDSDKRAESVKYHLVSVHRDRTYARYECKKCDKLFYDRTSYRKHMANIHGERVN